MNLTLVTRHVLSGVQVPPSLPGRVALGADAGFPSYMEGGSRWGRVLYMKFQDMPALSPCLPPLGILLKEPNPPGAAQDLLIGWKWRAQAQKGGRGNAGLYQSTAKRHRRGGRRGRGWVLLKIPRGIWRGARCAPGYAPPSGGHSPALPPSSATGEDRRQFITDPGSD